jgi:hypothetical protein
MWMEASALSTYQHRHPYYDGETKSSQKYSLPAQCHHPVDNACGEDEPAAENRAQSRRQDYRRNRQSRKEWKKKQ